MSGCKLDQFLSQKVGIGRDAKQYKCVAYVPEQLNDIQRLHLHCLLLTFSLGALHSAPFSLQ